MTGWLRDDKAVTEVITERGAFFEEGRPEAQCHVSDEVGEGFLDGKSVQTPLRSACCGLATTSEVVRVLCAHQAHSHSPSIPMSYLQ